MLPCCDGEIKLYIKIVKHPAVNRDVSCKSSSRLPLLSSRPAVTVPDSGRYCPWPAPIHRVTVT